MNELVTKLEALKAKKDNYSKGLQKKRDAIVKKAEELEEQEKVRIFLELVKDGLVLKECAHSGSINYWKTYKDGGCCYTTHEYDHWKCMQCNQEVGPIMIEKAKYYLTSSERSAVDKVWKPIEKKYDIPYDLRYW